MMHVESNVNSVIDPKESIHFPISYCVRYSHYLALQTICGVADSANKHDDVTNGSVYVTTAHYQRYSFRGNILLSFYKSERP